MAQGQARHTPRSSQAVPAQAIRRAPSEFTYSASVCASKLGKSSQWLRDNLDRLYARGMPRPIDQPGQRRWDRQCFDTWRNGFKGPKDAANDAAPLDEPTTLDEHRERLRRAYGAR